MFDDLSPGIRVQTERRQASVVSIVDEAERTWTRTLICRVTLFLPAKVKEGEEENRITALVKEADEGGAARATG